MDLGTNYFTHTLRRLRRLRRLVTRERSQTCWWCLKAGGEGRTEIVRRHSDVGLLRRRPDTSTHHNLNLSQNDIARLIWLKKMRIQTPSR